jgi:transposase InsO family protein
MRKNLGAPREEMTACGMLGFNGEQFDTAKWVTRLTVTVNGRRFHNIPCVELPAGSSTVVLGRHFFAKHGVDVSPSRRKLLWPQDLPPNPPAIPDIVLPTEALDRRAIEPVHQKDMERRDRRMTRDEKRRPDGKGKRVTWAQDQRENEKKMERALLGLPGPPPKKSRDERKAAERQSTEKNPLGGIQISFVSAVSWKVLETRARRQRKSGLPPEQCIQLDAFSLLELDKLIETKEGALENEPDDVRELILERLPTRYRKYADVFSKAASDALPPHRTGVDHKIELLKEHAEALAPAPLYQMSLDQLKAMKKYLTENLEKGFVVPTNSPYAAPVLMAKKPGGGWRFCVDYRRLNAITKKDRYPLPLIDETLTRLSRAKVYTKLDIRQAFHRIRMHPDSADLTAFRTRYGSYKYKVLPFGLCNGPGTFQRYINNALHDILDEYCTAYIDDILIYSEDPLQHEIHVKEVLERLRKAGLQADIKKSEFHVTTTKFLGYIVSTDGIRPDPEKVTAVIDWKTPSTVKGVQSFLGFCNYYRRFVRNFGRIARPLQALTVKTALWKWGDAEQQAFDRLKAALVSAPVLALYDPEAATKMETDASDGVLGGVLSQQGKDGHWHPVAYYSKTMTGPETRYEIHDKEMLAVVRAMGEWTAELQGLAEPFVAYTDHKALEFFSTKRLLNARQAGWSDDLSRFDYKITYRPGTENTAADALTRKLEDLQTQKAIKEADRTMALLPADRILTGAARADAVAPAKATKATPAKTTKVTWATEAVEATDAADAPAELDTADKTDAAEPSGVDLVDRILQANRAAKDSQAYRKKATPGDGERNSWTINGNGLLVRNGKLFVSEKGNLRTYLINEIHTAKSMAHPGQRKTMALLRAQYYWPGMGHDVARFRRNCRCVAAKIPRDKTPGLLHPLPIGSRPWQHVAMDFHSMPADKTGANNVFVVIDRFGKRAFSLPCKDTATARDAARLYFVHIWRVYGTPETVVSDRGPQFISAFTDELCKLMGTRQKLSTANHPQTDGVTEVYNQYLNQRLIPFVNHHQDDWSDLLPAMDFAQAALTHESTQISPFELEFGYRPRLHFDWEERTTEFENPRERLNRQDAQAFAARAHEAWKWAANHIRHSQSRAEKQANKRRREPDFTVGDMVWVISPNWPTDRPSTKLDWKRRGPYRIKAMKGHSYELDLPDSVKVHPVFHAEKLRKASTDPLPGQEQEEPPAEEVNGELEYEVEEIIAARVWRGKLQYKVRWKGWDEDPEWYPASNFKNSARLLKKYHERRPGDPGPPKNLHVWLRAAEDGTFAPNAEDDNAPEAVGPIRILRRPMRR